ncbi:metallothiol transferase FosB [Striga asiatica]|uniref:Metallothiol transferase FosB n=1 Tax=Striga asiatica TaxID=4170 RepID=A0A5A7PZE1_STRAF|nr:metallothiol transferase FosB [Striga asiatica]
MHPKKMGYRYINASFIPLGVTSLVPTERPSVAAGKKCCQGNAKRKAEAKKTIFNSCGCSFIWTATNKRNSIEKAHVKKPLILVNCTYVAFHCLSEDFNVLLRAGKFLPYPNQSIDRAECFFNRALCSFLSLVLGLDLSLILVKLKSTLLLKLFRVLFYRLLGLEVPIFVLVFLVFSIEDSSLHMMDPAGGQPAANPAAETPSRWTSRFWDKLTYCLVPKTQDGVDSISSAEPTISTWVDDVDVPVESPDDTINNLREKCAKIIASFARTDYRHHLTFHDSLVLERKEGTSEPGATREDFQRLLGELQNPGESDVYLRVLKALTQHPR